MGPPAADGGPSDRARENPTPRRNNCSGGSGDREIRPLSAAGLLPFHSVVRPATAASSSLQSSPSGVVPVGTPSADHGDLTVTVTNVPTTGTATHRSPLQRRRCSPPRQERIQGQWLKQQRSDYDTSPTRAATAPSPPSTAMRAIATPERRGGVRTAPSVPKTPTQAHSSDELDFPHRTWGFCEERNGPSFVCRGWGKPPTTPSSIRGEAAVSRLVMRQIVDSLGGELPSPRLGDVPHGLEGRAAGVHSEVHEKRTPPTRNMFLTRQHRRGGAMAPPA